MADPTIPPGEGQRSGMTSSTPASHAGAREWAGLALLCLPTFLVVMDFSVLYLAVPHLSAALEPSAVQQLWIVDVYGFLIAGLLITMGTLGDRIGHRRLLLLGTAAFGVASASAAFSTSPEMLIASRAALGIAGAAVTPCVLALVTGMFSEPGQRSRALALYLTCFMSGATLGPLIGGVLLHYFWWGSVFLVAVPGVVLFLVAARFLLPERRHPDDARLDPLSVLMSLGSILTVVYGLKTLARHGWEVEPVAALLTGVAIGFAFVHRQRVLPQPMLDLGLFRGATFRSALVLFFVTAVVGAGSLLLVTVYLQDVSGLTPLRAALLLLVPNIVMIMGNLGTPRVAARVRPSLLISGGLLIAGAGYVLLALVSTRSSVVMVFLAMCVVMLGTAPLAALCNQLAMGAVPSDKAGSGAALVQTTTELGLALGIATMASLAGAVYRAQVDAALAALPPSVAEASREGLGAALAAAAQLPSDEGLALAIAARAAFASGLHVVALVSAALYAGLAVLAIRGFARATMTSPDGED